MTGRRATLLVALAAVLAGCGSTPKYAKVHGHTVDVKLTEYRLSPEYVQVRAGRVRIVGHNVGRLTHNVAVVQFDRPLSSRDEKTYGRPTKTLFPGRSGVTTVDLKPGKYRLVCTIANHDNLGQYGELKVVPK